MKAGDRVFVVEEGENPSTDYFVMPFLREQGVACARHSFADLPPAAQLDGASVVFVRYVPAAWRALVERCRDRVATICFFMDDDLFDWRATANMPLRYQWKIFRYSRRHRQWLRSLGARLLVSTPYLRDKYADWRPRLLPPQPPEPGESPITLFYHGSASHGADLRWLRPVIAEVLARDERLAFEVIGNASVRRLFKGLPRVQVLHPMKWDSYRALIRRPGRNIGLAPLLDNRFNRARSHTKFFDITQAGAVGVYALGDVYGGIIRHEQNGLLLPMDRTSWVEEILRLAGDESLRSRLLEGARGCL